eukprot:scaffold613_cov79-Phaeocystis_antarctica.AAC.1
MVAHTHCGSALGVSAVFVDASSTPSCSEIIPPRCTQHSHATRTSLRTYFALHTVHPPTLSHPRVGPRGRRSKYLRVLASRCVPP